MRKLTMEAVVEMGGPSRPTLHRIEREEGYEPEGYSLERLAKVLQVRQTWLQTGEEPIVDEGNIGALAVRELARPYSFRPAATPDPASSPAKALFLRLMGHRIESLTDDQVQELERQIDHFIQNGQIKLK